MKRIINISLMMILIILISGLLWAINADVNNSSRNIPQASSAVGNLDIQLSKEEIPQLIEIIKIWNLVDEMNLTKLGEEKLAIFLSKYKELDKIRNDYYRNRQNNIEILKKLLETNASVDQIKTALNEINKETEIFQQREKQLLDDLNSNLSTKQQAEFIVFQDNQRREMKRLVMNLEKLSRIRERQLRQQPEALSKK